MNQVSPTTRSLTCEDCGISFESRNKGPKPKRCPDCKAKHTAKLAKSWRSNNKELCRGYDREWRGRNRTDNNARLRQKYWEDPEKARERSRTSVAKHRAENPEAWAATQARHFTPSNRRRHNLKAHYNMTPEDYDLMLSFQGGKCKICGETDPKTRSGRFNIDHCHETGHVRGLLCNPCNVGLGTFTDDISKLEAAIRYLSEANMGAFTKRAV